MGDAAVPDGADRQISARLIDCATTRAFCLENALSKPWNPRKMVRIAYDIHDCFVVNGSVDGRVRDAEDDDGSDDEEAFSYQCDQCGVLFEESVVEEDWNTRRALIEVGCIPRALWQLRAPQRALARALMEHFVVEGDQRALWIMGIPTPVDIPLWDELAHVVDVVGRRRRRTAMMERIVNREVVSTIAAEGATTLVLKVLTDCTF